MADDLESLRKSPQVSKGRTEVSRLINSITDYDEFLRDIGEFVPSTLAQRSFSNPKAIVEAFLKAEALHCGRTEQRDDLTILVGGLT